MSKTLKKILIAGSSLLMFVSVGTGINSLSNDNNIVHASSHHIPSDYWGTWTGHKIHRGPGSSYTMMKLGPNSGYSRNSTGSGRIQYLRLPRSFRNDLTDKSLRYEYGPYGNVNDTYGTFFGLHGKRLDVTLDTSLYRLHKIHHNKYVRKHYRKARKHIRKHIKRHIRHHSHKRY